MSLYTGKLKPGKLDPLNATAGRLWPSCGLPARGHHKRTAAPLPSRELALPRATVLATHSASQAALQRALAGASHVRSPPATKAPHNGAVRRQAAYLRVSTPQQSEAFQRDAIERAASARGEKIDLWVSEKASGKRVDRPQLESVRVLARRGELSHLWVFRLDRLARGAVFLLTVVEELKNHGCRVVTPEGIDTQGTWAPAIMATLGTAAEIELEAQRDRMAGARAKAEAAGKRWGRPRGPSVDRAAQTTILSVSLFKGLTLRQAAKEAGLSFGTAQRIARAEGLLDKKADG